MFPLAGSREIYSEKLTLERGNPTHLFPADVFTILTYAKKDAEVPKEWLNSDPHMILGNAEQVSTVPDRFGGTSPDLRAALTPRSRSVQVKLRSFSTNRHKVQGLVAYRLGQDII